MVSIYNPWNNINSINSISIGLKINMNAIYNKLRSKHKYTRKPMCANLDGVCDFDTCRCGYANILDKKAKSAIKKSIDENIHHREKVIQRKRDIAKGWNDIENFQFIDENNCIKSISAQIYRGTYSIEKERRAKINRNALKFIGIFVLLPILYIIVIYLYDLSTYIK